MKLGVEEGWRTLECAAGSVLLHVLHPAVPLIYKLLLSLNVLEHEPSFTRQRDIVRIDLAELSVELKDAWQPLLRLIGSVLSFEVLAKVVVDQVVFENTDQVSGLVVHDVAGQL